MNRLVALLVVSSLLIGGESTSASVLDLTADENSIATELKFNPKSLSIVKEATSSPLKKVDLSRFSGYDVDTDFGRLGRGVADLKAKLATFLKIRSNYPELAPVLDPTIEYLRSPGPSDSLKKWVEAVALSSGGKSAASILRERELAGPSLPDRDSVSGKTKYKMPRSSIEIHYDEKTLATKYAVRFFLPLTPEQKRQKRKSPIVISAPNTELIKTLNRDLNPIGYAAYGGDVRRTIRFFSTEAEAKQYLASLHNLSEFGAVSEVKPLVFETDLLSDGAASVGLMISAGSTVEKVAARKWKVSSPKKYIVSTELGFGFLVKQPSSEHSDNSSASKFDFVKYAGTGTYHGIDDAKLIEKLKLWDRQFGIDVIATCHRSLDVEFRTLPENMSELCNDVHQLCPDLFLEDRSDYEETAAGLRAFASELKRTKSIHFWWD